MSKSFEWIAPEPGVDVPVWVKGVQVEWHDRYTCPPYLTLITDCDPGEWPNEAWRVDGPFYITESGDGRAKMFAHAGNVSFNEAHARWETTQEEGFGGRCFQIHLEDGRDLLLRGPWDRGAPAGYIGVSFRDQTEPHHMIGGGAYGVAISTELFVAILARFEPALRCARLTDGPYRGAVEIVRAGQLPKHLQRRAA